MVLVRGVEPRSPSYKDGALAGELYELILSPFPESNRVLPLWGRSCR